MSDLTNLFPQWGDDGVLPSNGFFYSGGDQVTADNFNALWNGVQTQNAQLIDGVRDRVRDAVGDVVLNGGLVVSDGTNPRDVDVSASDGAYVDGQKVDSVSATTLTVSAGGPRTDSLYLTTDGTLGLSEGTTTVADNRMKVAEVDLGSGDTITAIRNTANDLQYDYVTETQPSGASAGDTWLDLSANRVKVYQNGGFRTLITEQDSITVSGGDGLSGGGSINLLGGSTSLDVNVSDFAGTHLSDDGSNNLTVDDDFVSNTGDTVNGDFDVTGTLSEGGTDVVTQDQLSPTITETKKASSFTESDISFTLNSAQVDNGSIELLPELGYTIDNLSETNTFFTSTFAQSDIQINDDGTKIYELSGTAEVIVYTLSTPYDITTASQSDTVSLGNQSTPNGFAWNNDGTKVFMADSSDTDVTEYTLSTPYDLSTLNFQSEIGHGTDNLRGISFNDDGTVYFTVDRENQNVTKHTLTTGFDISTLNNLNAQEVGTDAGTIEGVEFIESEGRMIIVGADSLYQYDIQGTDLSTLSLDTSVSLSGRTTGIVFDRENGRRLYRVDSDVDELGQFSVGQTPSTAGDVVIDPTLNDVFAFDLATFQKTLDGETVTMDVEDGGGATLFSDISRNFDISSIGPTTDVQLHAFLSRTDTNNNPTLDFAAMRYEQ